MITPSDNIPPLSARDWCTLVAFGAGFLWLLAKAVIRIYRGGWPR